MSLGFEVGVSNFYGTKQNLIDYVHQHNEDITFFKVDQVNQTAFKATVNNAKQASWLCRFNGASVNGNVIQVQMLSPPSNNALLNDLIDRIKFNYLNIKKRELDLSGIIAKVNQIKESNGIPTDYLNSYANTESFIKVIITKLKDRIPDLLYLNLANNGMKNVDDLFKEIKVTFPIVVSIDLSNNLVDNIAVFKNLKGVPIRNLILANNPVEQNMALIKRFVFYRH